MFRLVCVSIIKFRLVCVERLDCLHDCDIYICTWYVCTRIIDFCFAEDFHCLTAIHFILFLLKKAKKLWSEDVRTGQERFRRLESCGTSNSMMQTFKPTFMLDVRTGQGKFRGQES